MKKFIVLVALFSLILLLSSVLVYHMSSDDSITINQDDETVDSTDNVIDEIDDSLINEDDEVEIGEMI